MNTLDSQTGCGLITTADGQVAITHERLLPGHVEWVEYDPKTTELSIIYEEGKIQSLGIALDKASAENLANGSTINLIRVKGAKAFSTREVVYIVKDY